MAHRIVLPLPQRKRNDLCREASFSISVSDQAVAARLSVKRLSGQMHVDEATLASRTEGTADLLSVVAFMPQWLPTYTHELVQYNAESTNVFLFLL